MRALVSVSFAVIFTAGFVAGGKWQTLLRSPSWSANCGSPTFQSRERLPLLPPPSAVIISSFAFGNRCEPISRHQRRMLAVANRAVS